MVLIHPLSGTQSSSVMAITGQLARAMASFLDAESPRRRCLT